MGDKAKSRLPDQTLCTQCGYISSQEVSQGFFLLIFEFFLVFFSTKVCKACVLLAGLNKGLPQLGVGKSSKHRKTVNQLIMEQGSLKSDPVANVKTKVTKDIEDL